MKTASNAWRVTGFRRLGAGGSCELLSTSFGRTEERARIFFHKTMNTPALSNGLDRQRWLDSELTFTREDY